MKFYENPKKIKTDGFPTRFEKIKIKTVWAKGFVPAQVLQSSLNIFKREFSFQPGRILPANMPELNPIHRWSSGTYIGQ